MRQRVWTTMLACSLVAAAPGRILAEEPGLELRETIVDGTAYAGRHRVDTARRTVTHVRTVSLDPDSGEVELVRAYVVDERNLVLTGNFSFDGQVIHFAITWERID